MARAMLPLFAPERVETLRDRALEAISKRKMKIIAFILVLVCCTGGNVRAFDEPTPSPTPVYLKRHLRAGPQRRQQKIQRRRDLEAKSEVRSQTKADHRTGATAEAQARAAARAREKAQREAAAQVRSGEAGATPHATSELMTRMGFSEQEIAAQKAREQSALPGEKPATKRAAASPPVPDSP